MRKKVLTMLLMMFSLAVMAQQSVPQAYTYNVSNLTKSDFKKCMKAAKKGDAVQQFVLATCYKDGKWVDRDNMMAIDWYTKSADQGNEDAASVLAYVYETGTITEKNMTKAVTYNTRLAEQGYQRAQEFLGNWYYSQQDYASAVPWLTKTASQGNKDDQYRLGWLYYEGKGVSQNYTEAAKWFGKAAGQGDSGAQYYLGMCYMNGKGVSQNYDEAKKWLIQAADKGNANAKKAMAEIEEKLSKRTFTVNGVSFTMVYVKGGTFTMGATSEQGDEDPDDDEKPAHRVTLSDYHIGQTEVTQELWQAVMGSNPSDFRGSKRPVEWVSWDDCQTFINKLNSLTGERFRLPTEAEWEYAARGGQKSGGYKYSGSYILGNVAWYDDNTGEDEDSPDYGTHDVATKSPNELGLYDMSGNVDEWCQDWYDEDYYSRSPQQNPQGPSSGSYRVNRGGSWLFYAGHCRVAYRDSFEPDDPSSDLGLRLAL